MVTDIVLLALQKQQRRNPSFRKLWYAVVLLVWFISFSLSAQQKNLNAPRTISEEQDYAFAIGLYRDSLYQVAEQQFENFIQQYPKSVKFEDAVLYCADCDFQLTQYESAVRGYSNFIKSYPASRLLGQAYFRLGQAQLKLKRIADAVKSLKMVLDNFGDLEIAGEAAYWIGESYLREDDSPNAVKYYSLAYENYPKNRLRDYALYSVGWVHQKRGEYAQAAEWYEKLIVQYPQSNLFAAAHVRVGECYYYAKEYRKAIDTLTASRINIHQEEELGNADYLIAEAFYKLENYSEAQKKYAQFLNDHRSHTLAPEVTYDLAWSWLKQKNYSSALQVFQRLSAQHNVLGNAALYRCGECERLLGQNDTALQIFRDVVSRDSLGEWADHALFDAGSIYFENGKIADAQPFFQRVAMQFANSDVLADAERMLGECLLAEGNYSTAQPWFEKAANGTAVSFEVKVAASYQSAWCLMKMKRYRDAAQKFSEFTQTYPQHPKTAEAKYWLAETKYQLGDFDASSKLYSDAATVGGAKQEEALYGIAWSFFKQSKFAEAIDAFEKLLAAYPHGKIAFDARMRTADAYFYLKNYKDAENSYRMVIRLFPDSSSIDYAYYQLGQSYFKEGDNAEGYKAFQGLISALPKSSLADDAEFALGWINFQQKDYSDAIKEFQQLVKAYPKSELVPRAYYSIGDCYYNLQQYNAAEKSYREVLRQYPKSQYVADATTGIQYCFIAEGKDAQALEVIDEFVKENPNSSVAEELQMKKGELLFNQQKYDAAVRAYRTFVENYPHSSSVANADYEIARCYQIEGNPDEAALAFERVASINNAPEKIAVQALLDASDIYRSQKRFEKATAVLRRVPSLTKEPELLAAAQVQTGAVYLANGNPAEASSQFEATIKQYGETGAADGARVARARMYFAAGDVQSIPPLVERVATSRTDELGAEAQYLVGAAFAGKQDWQNAITALLRVRYVFPAYERWIGRANLGLGDAYEHLSDTVHARQSFQSVLKLKTEKSVIDEAQQRL
ncbi:MAG TPA: tetratricopeptide repeat protein, partial [Bacteroidota bacterium]|nr:tetratricopeptide repeat protein [Bacteroidota bacterium]